MIALIVTGHGKFASAMASAMQVIAGVQPYIRFIDFDDNSVEKLQKKFQAAIDDYQNVEGILVLSDLVGGSPFKVAAELAFQVKVPIEVIGGTNLAMIIEIALMRQHNINLIELVNRALTVGKESIAQFTLQKHQEDKNGDGI